MSTPMGDIVTGIEAAYEQLVAEARALSLSDVTVDPRLVAEQMRFLVDLRKDLLKFEAATGVLLATINHHITMLGRLTIGES